MKKEALTLENVKKDLRKVLEERESSRADWRLAYIIPVTLIAVVVGFLLRNLWLGLLIFFVAAYHIVRMVLELQADGKTRQRLKDSIQRGDVAVSLETLDHIARETVYEPRRGAKRTHVTKETMFFYFQSGGRWRVPEVRKHYEWSESFFMTSDGLDHTSVSGNTFYWFTLQEDHDVGYVYNTNLFDWKDR